MRFEEVFFRACRTNHIADGGGWLWFADHYPPAPDSMPYSLLRIANPSRRYWSAHLKSLQDASLHLARGYAGGMRLFQEDMGYGAAALVVEAQGIKPLPPAASGGKLGHAFEPIPAVFGFVGCRRELIVPLLLTFAVEHSMLSLQEVDRLPVSEDDRRRFRQILPPALAAAS